MKKNNSGITLVSLAITIIVLSILASIGIYSGIQTVRSSKLTKFTTEMKIMQLKVNEWYEHYPETQETGKDLSTAPQDKLNQAVSGSGLNITTENGYRYYDTDTIKALQIDGVDGEFFISITNRSVVSVEGFQYEGQTYYTLEQLPDGLYNVEYNPISAIPTFEVDYENIGDNTWKITISNIQYDGYINKWDVKYQIDGQSTWNTSEGLSFEVNKTGLYKIYIENGDVKSAETSRAIGIVEPTPDTSEETELEEMGYGVIEIEFLEGTSYNTTTTPNHPVLKTGMTAITYNEGTGTVQTVSNSNGTDWYSYVETTDSDMTDGGTTTGGNSHWANAKVTVNSVDSYFVWVPRYAYRIIYFDSQDSENKYRAGRLTEEDALKNGQIIGYSDARGIVNAEGLRPTDVSSQTTISVNGKYFKTHPVFDGNVEYGGWAEDNGTPAKLEGIWVAKYEAARSDTVGTTQGSSTIPKSAPGVSSWRGLKVGDLNIGDMFTYAKAYNTTLNSHLIKNSEWGAVAYLTESKYGRNGTEVTINNNSNYLTGHAGNSVSASSSSSTNAYYTEKGVLASSTGNIYGIYDLSGGAYEYVAGYYNGSTSTNLTDYGDSFASKGGTSTKYATAYTGITPKSNYKYGDATYETSGWNRDSALFVSSYNPFFFRGGNYNATSYAGVFYFNLYDGGSRSYQGFRVSLAVQ